ncbi:MAG: helix-turn-helix domain-containing protein [Clostridia bacterium]|nr:helix-turn-helix domain-containing protein [Clostridia bacterium]
MQLAENLKAYRNAMHITQKEMAERMNMVREQYAKYERGIIELDYEKIVKVCKILSITPNELFDGCLFE